MQTAITPADARFCLCISPMKRMYLHDDDDAGTGTGTFVSGSACIPFLTFSLKVFLRSVHPSLKGVGRRKAERQGGTFVFVRNHAWHPPRSPLHQLAC